MLRLFFHYECKSPTNRGLTNPTAEERHNKKRELCSTLDITKTLTLSDGANNIFEPSSQSPRVTLN